MSFTTLEVIVFPNTTVLPIYVGEAKGLFSDQGLRINLTTTPTSTYQMTNLIGGKYQIAIGAFDNILAYQEGQGSVIPDTETDLFAFMGVAQMNLQLVVQPEIRSYADLKGKRFAVDAVSTGFVLVLRKMLEIGGLTPDDYELIPVGTSRWETMKAGEHAGAIMTDNYMSGELSSGLRVLDNSLDVFEAYQSAVGSACRGWAAAHPDILTGFIRAYVACLDWIFEAANRAEAAEILARNREGMSGAAAEKAVGQLTSGREGLTPKAKLSMAGLTTVLELRNQFGEPRKELAGLDKYIDLSYYEAAVSSSGK